MNKIKEKLITAGGFPTLLIVFTLVFRIINFNSMTVFSLADTIACIVALISGLIYAFSGYIKSSAKKYKLFLNLYLISSLFSLANLYYETIGNLDTASIPTIEIFILILFALISIGIFVLTYVNNLGKKISLAIVASIIFINIFTFMYCCIVQPEYLVVTLTNLLLSVVLFIFVNEKYINKASRGAK